LALSTAFFEISEKVQKSLKICVILF